MNYDIIGDIHGQAAKLRGMLSRLGYRERAGAHRHPFRTAVFLGDFIDRGPEQREVFDLVRRMVDAGAAKAVMGNHEFNAIGWASPDPASPGEYLRLHNASNTRQHAEFLSQFGEGRAAHREAIAWFKTLPLYLDLGEIRVVHAWWHQPYADHAASDMARNAAVSESYLLNAFEEGSEHFKAVEGLLKGLEIRLAAEHAIRDHGGITRQNVRIKWWQRGPGALSEFAILPTAYDGKLPDIWVPENLPLGLEGDAPVFIGHYWLSGIPKPLTPKLACLDYSIGSGGPLVAYRWEGEPDLNEQGFICQH